MTRLEIEPRTPGDFVYFLLIIIVIKPSIVLCVFCFLARSHPYTHLLATSLND